MVEMTFDNVVKYAYIGLRIGVIVMSLLSIFGFILLLANMDDSNLNLIGKFFSIVSYTSYMVVLLLILLTQFEYELFMKYLMYVMYPSVLQIWAKKGKKIPNICLIWSVSVFFFPHSKKKNPFILRQKEVILASCSIL